MMMNFFYSLLGTKSGLISIGNVKESISVLSLLVDFAHECITLKKVSTIHEEVQRSCLWQLDSLSDDVVEMVGREIIWNKVPKMKYTN